MSGYESPSTDEPLGPGFFIFFHIDRSSKKLPPPYLQPERSFPVMRPRDDDEEFVELILVVLQCLR
jgi:hypothetical protein